MRRLHACSPDHPDLRRQVLWYFKWLVEELPEHADVPRETIEQVFQEMESFYRAQGEAMRPVYSQRCQAAVVMGFKEDAERWFEKWQAEPAGESDDCYACELDRKIVYLLDRDQNAEAIVAAEPILNGEAFCDDTPETLSRLIGPALKLENLKMAVILMVASGRPVRVVPSMLSSLAAHVVYRTVLSQHTRARRLALVALQRAQGWLKDLDKFNVYRACGMWASLRLLEGDRALRIPRRLLPGAGVEGNADGVEIATRCLEEAARIARRLDDRNGTDRYTNRLNDMEETLRKALTTSESGRG
jgi:hypothetical protein